MHKSKLIESFYKIYKGGLNTAVPSGKVPGPAPGDKKLQSAYFEQMKSKLSEVKYQIKGIDNKNYEHELKNGRFQKVNSS